MFEDIGWLMMSVLTVTQPGASFLIQVSGRREAIVQTMPADEQRVRYQLLAPRGLLVRGTLEGWH